MRWIGHPSRKLLPFEFLESFRCSISSVSLYYSPESDIRVKSYYRWNFYRASDIQFQGSQYVMYPNRASIWKFMTIWISRELPFFNFEHFAICYAPESDIRVKSYDHLNFSRASVVQFRASRYIISPIRTFERKLVTIWISIELPLFNFKCLDILCAWIGHLSEKLWPFDFLESFRCSISSVSLYYSPESDIRVKSYDHWNFYRAFDVQIRASKYVMSLNREAMWKLW